MTDCTECGQQVGLARPVPERGPRETRRTPVWRTMPHSRPEGGRCLVVSVTMDVVREVSRAEHDRERRDRGNRRRAAPVG